jgi:hypothetical protein
MSVITRRTTFLNSGIKLYPLDSTTTDIKMPDRQLSDSSHWLRKGRFLSTCIWV